MKNRERWETIETIYPAVKPCFDHADEVVTKSNQPYEDVLILKMAREIQWLARDNQRLVDEITSIDDDSEFPVSVERIRHGETEFHLGG